jgi:DNA-directed RNA polymerase specialized sigma24 family protein
VRPRQWTAFEEFVQDHGDGLVRLSFALCGDRGKAEDATQEALTRVYLRWSRLGDPLPYARRAVVNATRDSWRHQSRRQQREQVVAGYAADLPPAVDDLVVDRDRMTSDLKTYQPVEIVSPPFTRASTIKETWIPKSAANVAQTDKPQIPAGFRQVPPSAAFN